MLSYNIIRRDVDVDVGIQLRDLNLHNETDLTNEIIKDINETFECCICLDINYDLENCYVTKCCKQNLHMDCFIEWSIISFDNYNYTKCGICRTEVSEDIIKNVLTPLVLIEFKLKNPKYTYKIYKFLHIYFPNYILPYFVYENENPTYYDQLDNNTNTNNIDLENGLQYTANPRQSLVEQLIDIAKICFVILFCMSFIIIYIVCIPNK